MALTDSRVVWIMLIASAIIVGSVGGIVAGQTAEPATKVPAQYQYGDSSCYNYEIKLLHQITMTDPSDPSIPGMEIQARVYEKLFQEQQTC